MNAQIPVLQSFRLPLGFNGFFRKQTMKNISNLFKDCWAATGWRFISAGIGGGLAVFAIYMAGALSAMSAHAQTTIGVTTSNTLIQGSNAQVKGQYVTIDAASGIILKSPSITSSGAINTTGSVTAAKGYIQGMDVGNELINAKDSIVRNAAASVDRDAALTNALTAETADRTAGDADLDNRKADKTTVNALTTTVTNNAATAAAANAATNAALATEVTTRTNQVADLDSRKADKSAVAAAITAEENARIAGDVATLNSANRYTDSKIVTQSTSDRAYTDKAVAAESSRAQAAEAALSKETKQVGAMAMAAAGVAGATPAGDKKTAITAAVGGYSGETAIAVGVTRLVKDNTKIFGAFSKVSGGKTGVTVGASFSF